MDIRSLLDFIEIRCSNACIPVELTGGGRPMRLVLDADHCPVFLYGGITYEWGTGGQWMHMARFLHYFTQICASSRVEICVFFNGTSVRGRYTEWVEKQLANCRRIEDIVRFIHMKAFHPHRSLWMMPAGFHSVLRLVLLKSGVSIAASCNDHQLEIVSFMRENKFDGIVTCDPDLIMFNPLQRYISARGLNLSTDGVLSATEILVEDFVKMNGLDSGRLSILATLLGTHILPSEELQEFYGHICHLSTSVHMAQFPYAEKFHAVANFVKKLSSLGNLDEIAKTVFGNDSAKAQFAEHFKKSVEYYIQGTRAACTEKTSNWCYDSDSSAQPSERSNLSRLPDDGLEKKTKPSTVTDGSCDYDFATLDVSTLEARMFESWGNEALLPDKRNSLKSVEQVSQVPVYCKGFLMLNAGGYSSSLPSNHSYGLGSGYSEKLNPLRCPLVKWWKVAPEIFRIAMERSQKGLMMPWVYQIFMHGEIFLPPYLEEEREGHLLPAACLFRSVRRRVYSVLLERNSKDVSDGDAIVREWSVHLWPTPHAIYEAVPVPSPTQTQVLASLWLGKSHADVILRTQLFMDSFGCQPIQSQLTNMANIKPQFVVLCCILRYMVLQKSCLVIDDDTLRGFLSTAVSSSLQNPKSIKDLKIPVLSMRNVQLATLFMHGFENAVFANEAFGLPLPVDLFCPSDYFDGHLFQYKMAKISQKTSLAELCENSLEQQMHLERMQQTILSFLPKDCSYFASRLWTSVPRGIDGHTSRNFSGDVAIHSARGGQRGSSLNSFSVRSINCLSQVREAPPPPPPQKYSFIPPFRPNTRPIAPSSCRGRGRNNRSYQKNMKQINKESERNIAEPGRVKIAKRGGIGHPSTKAAPVAIGYGRGRGCTVEIELENLERSEPVGQTTLEFAAKLGRGRSSSFVTSEAKVGSLIHRSINDSCLPSSLPERQNDLTNDQTQNEEISSRFADAEISNLHPGEDHDEKRGSSSRGDSDIDENCDIPALIGTSPATKVSPRWSDLIETAEKSLSVLSLESDNSEDAKSSLPG